MARFLSPSYQNPKIVKINGINLGTGEGIFFGISGNSLQFKSLVAGTNVSLASDANEITINADFTDATTASNIGTGAGIFESEVGDDLRFKSLTAGANVTITPSADEIEISTSAEINTASNVGTGQGVFKEKSGVDLRFKTLKAGPNIILNISTDEIEIESTGGGGPAGEANTSSSLGAGVSFVAPKSGVDLPFRSLLSSAGLTWSQETNTVTASLHASLISIAGLTTSANKSIYTTASNTYATYDLSVFGRSLIDDADATAARTTLGLGTAATRNATTSATDTTSERLWRTNDLVKQTSSTDATAGRVLLNSAHGLGSTASIYKDNLNTISVTGFYFSLNGDVGVPGSGTWFVFHQQGNNSTRAVQYAASAGSGGYWVRRNLDGVWSTWEQQWTSANFDPTLKANLASPPFTGTPTAPTAAAGTNTTQIASTAFATSKTLVITPRTGTSYTFVLADNVDVYNRFTNAGNSTCTVPPNSSVAFPIGHRIPIRRAADANLTLTPGAGVTLNAPSGGTLVMTDRMTAELVKVGTNEWDVVGQTVAA